MNFTELRQELFARGSNYLEEDAAGVARADRWLNQAYQDILSLQAWPFLWASALAEPPSYTVSVPDLRKIRFVTDTDGAEPGYPGRPLARGSMDALVNEGADLSTQGTPEVYWVQQGNLVVPYPIGGIIRVDYIKRVPPMSGMDTPIFDSQYHDLIVDKAMVKVYKDSDNMEQAAAVKEEYNEGAASMAEDYMVESREPEFLEPTGEDS